MSKESLDQFSGALKSDGSLRTAIQAAKSVDEVVSIAAQHGHRISVVDLDEFAATSGQGELSDADLGRVSGGLSENGKMTLLTHIREFIERTVRETARSIRG